MTMSIDEWYEERVAKPKQEWAKVSHAAKLTKLRNKMSKRDIKREIRIEELGGKPIEIRYGVPLEEDQRKLRMEIEWDFKYPNRKDKKVPVVRKSKPFTATTGSKRSKEQFIYNALMGAKTRAKLKGVPFEILASDIQIPDKCPVLGIPLVWGERLTNNTPSIDRVIPEKGYVKGNCVVISMKANRLKNNASEEDLRAILKYVTSHNELIPQEG